MKQNKIEWGAVLHEPWVAGEDVDDIVHTWAEDGSTSIFKVPYQLRDTIVEIQGWLSKKYAAVDRFGRLFQDANDFFKDDSTD